MINSIEKLKRASSAVYFLDGAKEPADDCSSLIRWAVTEIERLREALKPFAEVGQWLHARPIPDDTPMVEFQGMNNYKIIVTRGHFKAASSALASAE